VTEHFSLEELTRTDHRTLDNTPDPAALANLHRLAEFLELVREVLGGRPVMITSGYRSKAVNDAVGSKDTSQHRLGLAADFRVPGMPPDAVVRAVVASGLDYDQLIREFDAWTHISIPALLRDGRREALVIDKTGTTIFRS
jgi:hypothetical protein